MLKLLKKEYILASHPVTPIMLLLSIMVIIPNYPYAVIFFYVSLACFFTCMTGRENKDVVYSLNLPLAKSSIVKARILYIVSIELIQLALMIPCVLLSRSINRAGNQAGMDANIALFAEGFIIYGVFNFIFFTGYYKNVSKVGVPFVRASIVTFLLVGLEITLCYTLHFVRDVLDTRDPLFITQKLIFLAVCILVYVLLNLAAYKRSAVSFEKQDING